MNMKNKLNWLEAALLIAPFVVLAAFWNRLPARVPVHWNLQGEIDGWASKLMGILMLPLISLGVVVLLRVLPWLDPKLRRTLGENDRMHTIRQIMRLTFAAFFGAIFSMQIAAALGRTIATGRVVVACTLVLLAIMGNYLGNLRPNYFAGIRTPWTLENSETWRATHRRGGRLMFFGALLLFILQFFFSVSVVGLLFVTLVLLLVAWGFVYSWHHFRTHVATRRST